MIDDPYKVLGVSPDASDEDSSGLTAGWRKSIIRI